MLLTCSEKGDDIPFEQYLYDNYGRLSFIQTQWLVLNAFINVIDI